MDDAVWEPYDSPTYGKFARWLKCAWKTDWIIRGAAAVTAGNEYVASHARPLNPDVTLLPTVVDTDAYRVVPARPQGQPVVLGWIGSHSTVQYLRPLLPVLERLRREVEFRLRVVGAGEDLAGRGLEIESLEWSLEREIEDVRSFDIGLFPVVEDAWSRGKSGFKAVQYGAVGIPTVASPVTTNRDIVIHGVTGMHAAIEDEWFEALRLLIKDPQERHKLGAAARERIVSDFSLAVHAPRFCAVLERARSSAQRR
jgi:glycosyltransferase involved in cell wall biosynthesis